mmetsp:Transcript_8338/g.12399  ORF Transcript_8338/g.12399 Transcript_8338/m.12399 type:complete len:259 (+) Transcript_8338:582-1358(+)
MASKRSRQPPARLNVIRYGPDVLIWAWNCLPVHRMYVKCQVRSLQDTCLDAAISMWSGRIMPKRSWPIWNSRAMIPTANVSSNCKLCKFTMSSSKVGTNARSSYKIIIYYRTITNSSSWRIRNDRAMNGIWCSACGCLHAFRLPMNIVNWSTRYWKPSACVRRLLSCKCTVVWASRLWRRLRSMSWIKVGVSFIVWRVPRTRRASMRLSVLWRRYGRSIHQIKRIGRVARASIEVARMLLLLRGIRMLLRLLLVVQTV